MSNSRDQTSITIRMSKSDKDKIKSAAARSSLDVSEYIRAALLNKLPKARPFERLLAEAISLFHNLRLNAPTINNGQLEQLKTIIGQLIALAKQE